jgi:hypothetical protein
MADKKISALTAATTPLAGTEVLPIVQGGSTVKVSVANLTAGRTASVAALGIGTASPGASLDISTVAGNVYLRDGTTGNASIFMTAAGASYAEFQSAAFGVSFNTPLILNRQGANIGIGNVTAPTEKVDMIGNLKISSGDIKIGTADKGIDFSAATHAAGMTSELLNDYEEGTWTPVFASAAGTITSYTVNAAKYTKVGRLLTLFFDVTITNNGTGVVAINVTGLPFAAAAAYSSCGTLVEVAAVGFGGFINQNSTTSLSLTNTLWAYPGGTNYRLIGSIAYNV